MKDVDCSSIREQRFEELSGIDVQIELGLSGNPIGIDRVPEGSGPTKIDYVVVGSLCRLLQRTTPAMAGSIRNLEVYSDETYRKQGVSVDALGYAIGEKMVINARLFEDPTTVDPTIRYGDPLHPWSCVMEHEVTHLWHGALNREKDFFEDTWKGVITEWIKGRVVAGRLMITMDQERINLLKKGMTSDGHTFSRGMMLMLEYARLRILIIPR